MTIAAILHSDSTRAAALAAARAVQAASGAPAGFEHRRHQHAEPGGSLLAKLVIVCSRAREQNRNPADIAAAMFARDDDVLAVTRSLTGVADTSTATWAAALLKAETRAVFEEIRPLSAFATLASLGLSVGFGGAASVAVPQLNVGTGVGGGWTGEGGAIPLVKGNLAATRLRRFKVSGIVPISVELARTSDPGAIEVMRVLLNSYLANLLDQSLLDDAAEVPGVRPQGLLYGVTPIPGATGGGLPALTADIKALVAALVVAGFDPRRTALVVGFEQWAAFATMVDGSGSFAIDMGSSGQVQTFPVIASAFLPAGEVVAVASSHFATATDEIEIDTSGEATLTMADAGATPPTQAGASALGGALGVAGQVPVDGGAPVSGGSGESIAGVVAAALWQSWSVGVRVVVPVSFAATKPGAVQAITATW